MSRNKKNKNSSGRSLLEHEWFMVMAAVIVCLAFSPPQAGADTGWMEKKLLASDGNDRDGFGRSVSVSGCFAIVGAYWDDDTGNNFGSAYIFRWVGTSWVQQQKLLASDGAAGDHFGCSVSISGDYAIVGADGDDGYKGSAYIFWWDGISWVQQQKLTASDRAANDYFGCSVSISGDYAIVGAPQMFTGVNGKAYIFRWDGASWVQQQKLTASDGAGDDCFGWSVSINISGDYAIVGAWWDDDKGEGSGSAYIFKRDGTSWSQQQKLTASDGATYDEFGCSVSISGNYAIVGAFRDDDKGDMSGSAYIFKWDGTAWVEQQKLTASDGAAGDGFGYSASISGNYAIVGASGDDDKGNDSGSAYIFNRNGETWSQQAKLLASDGAANDYLGKSVSISGDYAIVGAKGDDDKGDMSGSAYIFTPMDTDKDGLLDTWETKGIDINGDGTIDLNLPALGANPNHKDLFVEVDAMEGRAPAEATLQRVVDKFAAVPNALVNNPDGNDGITLHCLPIDEVNIPDANWPNAWADFDDVKAVRFGTPAQRNSGNWANIRLAKTKVYRYCIFANTHSGGSSSGYAERPGNDFMVTLGRWRPGDPNQQAGTFMHELGHNLGLIHGGDQEDPDKYRYNFKPNYHSIMNYTWQFPIALIEMGYVVSGNRQAYHDSWTLDYSRQVLPTLDESNLEEPNGIGGKAGDYVPVGPPDPCIVNENGPVDWNRDGDTNDLAVAADINRLRALPASPNDILLGYNDWSNLRYQLFCHPNFQDGVHIAGTFHDEMTFEMFMELSRIGCALADLNCDGHVDFVDFAILGNQWLQTPDFPSADIAPSGGDDMVDFLDLAILAEHWLEGI